MDDVDEDADGACAAVVVRGAVEGVAGVVVVGSRGRSRNSSSGIQSRRPRRCPRPSSSIYLFLAVVIMAMIFLAMLLSSPLQWLHATMFIVAAFIHVDVLLGSSTITWAVRVRFWLSLRLLLDIVLPFLLPWMPIISSLLCGLGSGVGLSQTP